MRRPRRSSGRPRTAPAGRDGRCDAHRRRCGPPRCGGATGRRRSSARGARRAGGPPRRGSPGRRGGSGRRSPAAGWRCDPRRPGRSVTGRRAWVSRRWSWSVTARTLRRAMAAEAASRPSASVRTRATRSWAQAVGVLATVWATSSATEVSTSCPTPVMTGTEQAAMARATASSSKAARSVRAPPPRTRASTSRRMGGQHADRRRDGPGRVLTLHPRVDAEHPEGEPAPAELVEEVGLGRRALARDQADPEGGERQGTTRVGTEQPLRGQPREQLRPGHLELTQRVRRVDRRHPQLQLTARGVPVEPPSDPHVGAVGHPHATPGVGERGVHRALRARGQHHAEGGTTVRIGQGEVHVAGLRAATGRGSRLAPRPRHGRRPGARCRSHRRAP